MQGRVLLVVPPYLLLDCSYFRLTCSSLLTLRLSFECSEVIASSSLVHTAYHISSYEQHSSFFLLPYPLFFGQALSDLYHKSRVLLDDFLSLS